MPVGDHLMCLLAIRLHFVRKLSVPEFYTNGVLGEALKQHSRFEIPNFSSNCLKLQRELLFPLNGWAHRQLLPVLGLRYCSEIIRALSSSELRVILERERVTFLRRCGDVTTQIHFWWKKIIYLLAGHTWSATKMSLYKFCCYLAQHFATNWSNTSAIRLLYAREKLKSSTHTLKSFTQMLVSASNLIFFLWLIHISC